MKLRSASGNPKLLVVERKLISNRGHHHTQIGALKALFPDHEFFLVAGEGYDGFAGEAVDTISGRSSSLSRHRAKLKFGSMTERLAGILACLLKGQLNLPASAYGQKLVHICSHLKLTPQDVIVVPTADIDTLESAIELSQNFGLNSPRIILRFLSPTLGGRQGGVHERRVRHCKDQMLPNIRIYTETEELAHHLNKQYAFDVVPGFFMPCSIGFSDVASDLSSAEKPFRVGVFGAPRPEKGSRRIAPIVRLVASATETTRQRDIEFVVQGSKEDFSEGGVYKGLLPFVNAPGTVVCPVSDRLAPNEFERLFKSVDLILLPYDVNVYGLQGSGVIQDAVAALKPVVYSKGMSMVSFLGHGNALAATSDDDFAHALLQVIEDPSRFSKGTVAAAEFFHHIIEKMPAQLQRTA